MTFPRSRFPTARAAVITLVFAVSALAATFADGRASAGTATVVFGPADASAATFDTVTVPILLSAADPGVGALDFGVTYDPDTLTPTGCDSSYVFCGIETVEQDTVSFAGFAPGAIVGTAQEVATITFATSGPPGQTELEISYYDLVAPTGDHLTADLQTGTVSITAPSHTQGNINCLGDIGLDDVTAFLAALAGIPYTHLPGCTPPGESFGPTLWADLNCDRRADEGDVLFLLLHLSGEAIFNGSCSDIGEALN